MKTRILLAKESFLSGKTFVEGCMYSVDLCKGAYDYDCVAAAITEITGKVWTPNFITNFSAEGHPKELYLKVFDKALERP